MANVEVVEIQRVPFGARVLSSTRRLMQDTSVDPGILGMATGLLWFALLVPPQMEFVAQKILRRYGLRTFVPVRREWRRRNKFVKTKELQEYPIAPRYVFAGFDRRFPLWFDLFNLPVISGAVGLNGEPLKIPGKAMARLIQRTGGGLNAPAVQKFMRTHHEFTVGQIVEVLDGPFEGRRVPVVEIRGHRALLLLELFGGQHEIDVSMEVLQAA